MATRCHMCDKKNPLFMHHVYLRGYWHLCTTCVLNHALETYCSICFKVFKNLESPAHGCIECEQCKAIAHISCIPSSSSAASSSNPRFHFLCPFCSDPSISFGSAKHLLCAASISRMSMRMMLESARIEAELRIQEAASANRAARDAMARLAALTLQAGDLEEDGSEDDSDDAMDVESEDGSGDGSDDDAASSGGMSPTFSGATN